MQLNLILARQGMRLGVCGAALLVLVAGCSLRPGWHWEKPGADDAAYEQDIKFCKLQAYSGADIAVTNENVRRMHACMQGRGWRKVSD